MLEDHKNLEIHLLSHHNLVLVKHYGTLIHLQRTLCRPHLRAFQTYGSQFAHKVRLNETTLVYFQILVYRLAWIFQSVSSHPLSIEKYKSLDLCLWQSGILHYCASKLRHPWSYRLLIDVLLRNHSQVRTFWWHLWDHFHLSLMSCWYRFEPADLDYFLLQVIYLSM